MAYEFSPEVREMLVEQTREGRLAREIARTLIEQSGKDTILPFVGFYGEDATIIPVPGKKMKGYSESEVYGVLRLLEKRGLLTIGAGDFGVCTWGFKPEVHEGQAPNDDRNYVSKDENFRRELSGLLFAT
jgi:hypothetical protein